MNGQRSKRVDGYKYTEDKLYPVWSAMVARCNNPKNCNYKNYGARGITVCQEWKDDFFKFKAWAIESGYDYNKTRKEQQLDRADNDGNYCPENCHWVTAKENSGNRRNIATKGCKHKTHSPHGWRAVVWTINGETKTAAEWCRQYDIKYHTVNWRIKKCGMTPFEALTTPLRGKERTTILDPSDKPINVNRGKNKDA